MYGENIAQILGVGNFFGESALLDGRTIRNASCKCTEDTELVFLPSRSVINVLSFSRELRESLDELSHKRYRLRAVKILEEKLKDERPKLYRTGDVIFKEGDISNSLFIVKRGKVESVQTSGKEKTKQNGIAKSSLIMRALDKNETEDIRVLSQWREGDVFGISALISGNAKRMATARVTKNIKLIYDISNLYFKKKRC